MRTRLFQAGTLLATLALVASACGPSTSNPSPASGAPATAAPGVTPGASQPAASFAAADLRWYCCLGTGEDPAQIPTEEEVAAGFGTKHAGSSLKFEVTTYDAARDTLSTQIASGNAPDIVGPVGVGGIAAFDGQWLDLTDVIASSGYDTSQFDPAAVDFYNTDAGQIGLPFAVYPSMLWYKADLFEEAGLEPPPHEYGAKYTMPDGSEVDWSYDTIKEIAKLLTVDNEGRDATDPASIRRTSSSTASSRSATTSAVWVPTGAPAASRPTTARRPRSPTPGRTPGSSSTTGCGPTTRS